MRNHRKIAALRAIAERPGTDAEGAVAREMMARLESQPVDQWASFASYLKTGSMDDLADACGPLLCECGAERPMGGSCSNTAKHELIRTEIRLRFPRGTRVFYNRWAYPENAPGRVTGYPVRPFRGDWHWIRIKFDHLKAARSVPAYSPKGWHLTTYPVDRETLDHKGLCGHTAEELCAIQEDIRKKCGLAARLES